MKCNVILFVILMAVFSCTREVKEPYDIEYVVLNIEKDSKSNGMLYMDFIDTVYILPLETKEESLIKNISSVEITENNIIVHDDGNMIAPLLFFDKYGNYCKSIPMGNGPGELIYVTSMNYNIYDSCLIVFELGKFVSAFTSDGTFIEKRELAHVSNEIIATEDGYLLRNYEYSNVRNNDGFDDKLVLYADKDFNIKNGWIDSREGLYGLSSHRYFYYSGDKVIATSSYNDTIYEYKDNELRPILVLQYPNRLGEKYMHKDVEEPDSYMDFYGEMGDNGDHQFFIFQTGKDEPMINIIRDKNSGHIIKYSCEKGLGFPVRRLFVPRFTTNKGFFILDVESGNEQIKEKLKPYLSDQDKEILQNMTDDDNPVLLFFRFKRF